MIKKQSKDEQFKYNFSCFADNFERKLHQAKSLLYSNNYIQAYQKLYELSDLMRLLRSDFKDYVQEERE